MNHLHTSSSVHHGPRIRLPIANLNDYTGCHSTDLSVSDINESMQQCQRDQDAIFKISSDILSLLDQQPREITNPIEMRFHNFIPEANRSTHNQFRIRLQYLQNNVSATYRSGSRILGRLLFKGRGCWILVKMVHDCSWLTLTTRFCTINIEICYRAS